VPGGWFDRAVTSRSRSGPASRRNPIERRLSRFLREPVSIRNATSVIVTTTLVIVVIGGAGIRLLDHDEYSSIWQGMWWALQTVTTVGYGDVTPTNAAGKLVGVVVMLQGVAFVVIVTAAVTSTFVARAQAQRNAEHATEEHLAEEHLETQLKDISGRLQRLEQLLSEQRSR
jgi:voltage-gated potassium channel